MSRNERGHVLSLAGDGKKKKGLLVLGGSFEPLEQNGEELLIVKLIQRGKIIQFFW